MDGLLIDRATMEAAARMLKDMDPLPEPTFGDVLALALDLSGIIAEEFDGDEGDPDLLLDARALLLSRIGGIEQLAGYVKCIRITYDVI